MEGPTPCRASLRRGLHFHCVCKTLGCRLLGLQSRLYTCQQALLKPGLEDCEHLSIDAEPELRKQAELHPRGDALQCPRLLARGTRQHDRIARAVAPKELRARSRWRRGGRERLEAGHPTTEQHASCQRPLIAEHHMGSQRRTLAKATDHDPPRANTFGLEGRDDGVHGSDCDRDLLGVLLTPRAVGDAPDDLANRKLRGVKPLQCHRAATRCAGRELSTGPDPAAGPCFCGRLHSGGQRLTPGCLDLALSVQPHDGRPGVLLSHVVVGLDPVGGLLRRRCLALRCLGRGRFRGCKLGRCHFHGCLGFLR
mmetsp:Transcript_37720/g.105036  ORF Transcript_37720/g.105036 Transcript_37720/m.105036 type:complete len:310 (+) Transcript_37720:70-999(+)